MALSPTQTIRLAKVKAASDAPNYRMVGAASLQKCATCSHFKGGRCDLYSFQANPQYTCDDWRPNVEALRAARATKATNYSASGGGRGSVSSPSPKQASQATTAALVSLRRGKPVPPSELDRLVRLGMVQIVDGRPVMTARGQRMVGTTKETGSTPTAAYGHGPGGTFSAPGLGGGKKRTTKPGKSPGPSIKNPEVYEALLKKGYSKEQAARISNAMAGRKKELAAFAVYKDKNGRHRWIAISSNSYRDRDGEIVSQKALEADVERADKTGEYGPLRFWHMPGVDIGAADFNMMRGRMLIESGMFKDERIGQKVAEKSGNYQLSIGFAHPRGEPDSQGVFHNIRRFERSLVPAGRAANPFTSLSVKEPTMNLQEKIAQFKALLDDEEIAGAILAQADTAQKQADGMGIAFKEATEAELTAMSPDELLDYALARKEAAVEAEKESKEDDEEGDDKGNPFEREMKGYMTKMDGRLSHIEKMMGERHSQKDDEVADTVKSVAEATDAHAQRLAALETAVKERTEQLQAALKELQEVTGAQPRAFTEGGQRPTEDPANVTNKEAVVEAAGVANGAVTAKGFDDFLSWVTPAVE